jgi:tetratricopeptide (TPR) repeat protein
MKTLLSFLLLFFHLNIFAAGTAYDTLDASKEYQKAENFINNKDFKSALKVLKDLINEDPNGYTKADLYNYLGFATRKKSNPDYELAESYYLRALEINNNHVGAMEYLGELYLETDRRDEALVLLDRIKMSAGVNSNEYKDLNKLLN